MINGQGIKRELPPAHFFFEVDSYSKLFKEFDDGYQSGIFEADDYKWRLIFYPNGNKKRNANGHISLYLAIDDSNIHSGINWTISVNFKFFVHDQNEHRYLAIEEADGVVREFNRMKKEWGFDRLLTMEAFTEPSNGFLVNDSCAFGVEVFVRKCSDSKETLSMVSVEPAKSTYEWKIPNFRELAYVGIYSPDECFTLEERKWKLKIFPMGDGSEKGRCLALYLMLDQEDSPQQNRKMYAKFKMRVKNRHRKKSAEKQLGHWYSTDQSQRGSNEFVPLDDLYDENSGYLSNNILTVEVQFVVVSEVEN